MDGVPAAGDKFVVKRPAASLVWTGNLEMSGIILGLSDIRLDGPGGATYSRIAQLQLYIKDVWFTGIGTSAFTIGTGGALRTIRSTPGLFAGFDVSGSRAGAYFHAICNSNLTINRAVRIANCMPALKVGV
jgi:hypothetical protein